MEKNWNSSWDGFKPGRWNRTSVNVRNFIQENYTPYEGDDSFLAGPTEATEKLWAQVMDLSKQEREAGGVLDMDTKIDLYNYFSRTWILKQRLRTDCWFPDRQTFQTFSSAIWRYPYGTECLPRKRI